MSAMTWEELITWFKRVVLKNSTSWAEFGIGNKMASGGTKAVNWWSIPLVAFLVSGAIMEARAMDLSTGPRQIIMNTMNKEDNYVNSVKLKNEADFWLADGYLYIMKGFILVHYCKNMGVNFMWPINCYLFRCHLKISVMSWTNRLTSSQQTLCCWFLFF